MPQIFIHGRSIGGRNWNGGAAIPSYVNHVLFYDEFPEARSADRFAEKDRGKVLLKDNWTDAILTLQQFHPNGAKAAVFLDGTIKYSPETAG